MDKELIWTIVISILSSAGVAAIINGIFTLIYKKVDADNKKQQDEKNIKNDYLQKKEQVYIKAIDWLLAIRQGFDFTSDDLRKNDILSKKHSDEMKQFQNVSAALRLYSTDKIYTLFSHLNKYQMYQYSNGWRLCEEDKFKFVDKINILSDLMKADLNFRKYDDNPKTIICPECSREHDYIETCKCGLTFEKLLDIEIKNIKIENELKKDQNK